MSFFRAKAPKFPDNPYTAITELKEHTKYEAHKEMVAFLASVNTATPELANWIKASKIGSELPIYIKTGRPKNLGFFQIANYLFQLAELKETLRTQHPAKIANIDIAIIDSIIERFRAFPQFNKEAYPRYEFERKMINYTDDLLGNFKEHEHTILRLWIMDLKSLYKRALCPNGITSPFQLIETAEKNTEADLEKFNEALHSFRLQVHALNEEIKSLQKNDAFDSPFKEHKHDQLDKFVAHLTRSFATTQHYVPPLVPLYEATITKRF